MANNLGKILLVALSSLGASVILGTQLLKPVTAESPDGPFNVVQSGDVTSTSAVIWGRNDQPGEMLVELSTSADFKDATIYQGPGVGPETDYTGKVWVRGLLANTKYYYRVSFQNFANNKVSKVAGGVGSFGTAPVPEDARSVRFIWGADIAGQGWGRNPDLEITAFDGETIKGGFVFAEVMGKLKPDFAVFSGDIIYADNAIPPEKEIPSEVGGGIWVNEPAKDFRAVTVDEFRANWKYNLGDQKFSNFLLKTPVYAQWDDHEVVNNWYPGEIITEEPYNGISADVLAERSKKALLEYNPIGGETIYRKFQHGKHLEVFLLDERSFRGPNFNNSEPFLEMLGENQFSWLKESLENSTATWKVIATHDPLSIVTGGEGDRDSWGQGDPKVLGREAQLAQLLSFIKEKKIKNVVYISADVHFAAAIKYDPERAVFKDFNPFYEFVIGPIHAGVFGPGELDPSFGSEYEFVRGPGLVGIPAASPPPNLHSFGSAEVDEAGKLTVYIHDLTGEVLYQQELTPKK